MNRILVVDDDSQYRRSLVWLLRSAGYMVAEAADGQEAFTACLRTPPDLIVLDLRMPVMDGVSFLQRFREVPQWHTLPVVLVTAEEGTAEMDRAMAHGVVGYFLKGHMATERLLACIGCALREASPRDPSGSPAEREAL